MKFQRLAIALSIVNIALLVFLVVHARQTSGQTVTTTSAADSVLRVRTLEVVDDRGQVRARMGLKGDAIELDLFDKTGRVRAKFGGGEGGSGLFLADETGNVGVQILARLEAAPDLAPTGIVVKGKNGEQVIRP